MKQKIVFLKRMFLSIKDFESYILFASESLNKTVKYISKLLAIFVAVVAMAVLYKAVIFCNDGFEYLKSTMPEFTYSNSVLKFETNEPIFLESDIEVGAVLIIDTNVEDQNQIDEYIKKIDLFKSGILLLNDRAYVKYANNKVTSVHMYSELSSKFGVDNLDKQTLIYKIEKFNNIGTYLVIFILCFIILYFTYIGTLLIDIIMVSILGYLSSRLGRIKLKYPAVLNISIYSFTLPIVLNIIYVIINTFTGFTIKYFSVMYTSITMVYVLTAILLIKTDFIKKQMEISKLIMSEEGKVDELLEELQQEKDERQRQKEDRDKEKEDVDTDEGKSDDIGKGQADGADA